MKRILVLATLIVLGHFAQHARSHVGLTAALEDIAPPMVRSTEL